MDGTLVDSTAGVVGAWELFKEKYPSLDVTTVLSSSHGVRTVENLRIHCGIEDPEEQEVRVIILLTVNGYSHSRTPTREKRSASRRQSSRTRRRMAVKASSSCPGSTRSWRNSSPSPSTQTRAGRFARQQPARTPQLRSRKLGFLFPMHSSCLKT